MDKRRRGKYRDKFSCPILDCLAQSCGNTKWFHERPCVFLPDGPERCFQLRSETGHQLHQFGNLPQRYFVFPNILVKDESVLFTKRYLFLELLIQKGKVFSELMVDIKYSGQ